ncbi:MAG: VOC family protein [Phenylobacterium sp.]|uniref:VOC family protein n=1 Tax=Phenylobacterium sp. TaxID=1871053 RepID=UPI00121B11C4|nr:VOC family protein [Phenylobacterium sp.]TAJ68454.1 MAG: VOC family protein [Phenylobacterium sp.]
MELHTGRMIDHIHLRTQDLDACKRFYGAIMDVLGIPYRSDDNHFQADELWIDAGGQHSHVHLAFQAKDRETVDRVYKAALAAGGKDNGPPGERDYHPGYYGGFVLDPDGNNIEAVHHGPADRSADSVTISFEMPKA